MDDIQSSRIPVATTGKQREYTSMQSMNEVASRPWN